MKFIERIKAIALWGRYFAVTGWHFLFVASLRRHLLRSPWPMVWKSCRVLLSIEKLTTMIVEKLTTEPSVKRRTLVKLKQVRSVVKVHWGIDLAHQSSPSIA